MDRRAAALTTYLALRAERLGHGSEGTAYLELHLLWLYQLLPWPASWLALGAAL